MSDSDHSAYDDESEMCGSEEGDYYDEEGGEYDDYDEYYEEGEYEEIEYDEEWDEGIEYDEMPDIPIPAPSFKVEEPMAALVEDDPTDPRTWSEARQVYDESDSEDDDNHEEALREMMEAKIIENRKAILADPLNILKPKQIVERLNLFKRKKLQEYKDEVAKNNNSASADDITAKEKEIEAYIERIFSPAAQDFNELEYIAAIHGEVSFEQLKTGATFLRANIQQNTIQLKQFVQKNIQRYVTCKDTIDVIGEEIQHNELSKDRGTGKLISSHQEIFSAAKSTYGPLYKRKKEAEHLRRVLHLLERHKFLLNLPASMKQSMDRGDYEQVLRDYQQSKELRQDKSLAVFQPIMNQVDLLVAEFEKVLLKSLEDSSVSLAQHKKTMQLLCKFGNQEDPFWYFLEKQQAAISSALSNAVLPTPSNLQISILTLAMSSMEMGTVSIGTQVKRACEIFSLMIPEFYSYCVQYNEESAQKEITCTTNRDPFALLTKTTNQFIDLFREILMSRKEVQPKKRSKKTTKKRSVRLETVLRDDINDPQDCLLSLLVSLKQCKEVKALHKHIKPFRKFVEEITNAFFEQAIAVMISKIKSQECNVPADDQDNIQCLKDLLSTIENTIQVSLHDWSRVLAHLDSRKSEINQRFVGEGMLCFLSTLERTSGELRELEDMQAYEDSLLILLQCAQESRISVFPRIIQHLCGNAPLPSTVIQKFEDDSKKLEKQLIHSICESKGLKLDEILNETTWSEKGRSKEEALDVGSYAKNILLQLVMDHAQIFGILPDMTKPIISQLIEHVLNSLLSFCNTQVENINYNKDFAHQILVDVLFFHDTVKLYSTKKAREQMQAITGLLEKGKLADKEQVTHILKLTKIKTRVLYHCFSE